jgi:hypothetical protein
MATYTLLHVLISLVAIGSGLVVAFGMLNNRRLDGWTVVFLATTVATSLTGFGFPFVQLLPSHVVGAISLVVLAIAIVGRYMYHLAKRWRSLYVVSAVLALYLNVFVLVVQAFMKVPSLNALAPTQTESAFGIAQLVVAGLFLALGIAAVRRFRNTPAVAEYLHG